eukprot:SAG31_NODE_5087_length_2751_cov_2.452866_1_plen_235_part_00
MLLGQTSLAETVRIEGRATGRLTASLEIPYSITLLSSGVDYAASDLLLHGRNGQLNISIGSFTGFALAINFEHEDLLATRCAAIDGQYFSPGSCHAITGETCSFLACPARLGVTTCVQTPLFEQDRCECSTGYCLAMAPDGTPTCVARLASEDEQHDSCAGSWVRTSCTDADPLSICGGICQMQTSQSGSIAQGQRETTTCVETSTEDCDCGFISCSTEHRCACTTCFEEWVCD